MSELAFNLAGESFEVPSAAVGWRVRRLKPKGAPEVVYGRDGIPLILPIEAEMEDLRHEARLEGRYRLDPLDDQNRMIPNAPAGYVYLHPVEQVAEPTPPPAPVPQGPDHAVIEAMRMNTELARTIIERFPAMLDSAAGLLRAADGAGMPARAPQVLPEPTEEDDEPEIEETVEVAAKPTGWAGLLETLIPLVAPAIMSAITSGKVQLPGGVAALFGGRPTPPKASAASAAGTRTASTPGAAPAPSPVPASARHATSSVRASGSRDTAPVASEAAPAGAPGPSDTAQVASKAPNADHAAASGLVNAPGSATEITAELPTLDMAALAHFAAIQGALTFREGMLARALAAELSPAEMRTWLTELQTLSVPEAVARIRAVLGSDDSDNTSGGAS